MAEAGTRDYGQSEWFFIRELAQNSRDADATRISVTAGYINSNIEFVSFVDNGYGMTLAHAKKYLFRLYASSKEHQENAAGKFGIGFWTVLKFNPDRIIIESKYNKEVWGVELNADLEVKRIDPKIKKNGTKITLLRWKEVGNPVIFLNNVKEAVLKFCIHLKKQKTNQLLPVFFNGEIISKEMALPGLVTRKFKSKRMEGIVGLSEKPSLKLYSKGLPVWDGLSFDDLSDSVKPTKFDFGMGLAPVYLIDSDGIELNITRKHPLDNQHLKKVIQKTDAELSNLVFDHIKMSSQNTVIKTIQYKITRWIGKIKNSFFLKLILLLVLIVPLELIILKHFSGQRKETTQGTNIQVSVDSSHTSAQGDVYRGQTVLAGSTLSSIIIEYEPKSDQLIKLFSANTFRQNTGFVYKSPSPSQDITRPQSSDTISFTVHNFPDGRHFLPVIANYRLDPNTFNSSSSITKSQLTRYEDDSVILNNPHQGNRIRYTLYKNTIDKDRAQNHQDYLDTDKISWPPNIENALERFKQLPAVQERIKGALGLTGRLIVYDRSASTAEQYRTDPNRNWTDKILAIKKGDCDVINGLFVLILRELNIPSKLVIGYVGVKGKAQTRLHAWTEYYDKQWKTIDASIVPDTTSGSELPENITDTLNPDLTSESREHQPGRNEEASAIWINIVIVIIVTFGILSLVIIAIKLKEKKKDRSDVSEILSKIALNALIYPSLWNFSNNIWKYKFIPIMGKRFISMEEMLRFAKQNTLFYGSISNPLISDKIKKKLTVIDKNAPHYDEIFQIIPGKIDLDYLHELNISSVSNLDTQSEINRFLHLVQRSLDKISKKKIQLFYSKRLQSDFMVKQHSNKLIKPYKTSLIIINPNHSELNKLMKSYQQNRGYGIFNFIHLIIESYGLSAKLEILLKRRLAEQFLKQAYYTDVQTANSRGKDDS